MNNNNLPPLQQGVVVKKNIGSYHVRTDEGVLMCGVSSRLNGGALDTDNGAGALQQAANGTKMLERMEALTVGDVVRLMVLQDGRGLITEALPRRNRLVRRDPHPDKHRCEQTIAANLDLVVPIFAAASPTPKWGLLDRYLVSAEAFDLPTLIVITKLDLVRSSGGTIREEIKAAISEYHRIGYCILLTSTVTGEGLDELRHKLKGRLSALVGKSGVGKTSLLNLLEPGLGLRVGMIGCGRVGKGKHTTSAAEMFPTSFGAKIVDTPGVREFGLPSMDGGNLAVLFPEMRNLVGRCRFGLSCSHEEEPGCAIRAAVMDGKINPRRYQSYLRIKEEV